MLLTVTAACCSSHPRLRPVRSRTNGGAGAPPRRAGAVKFRALTAPLLRRPSSFAFSRACSSSPPPTPGDKDCDRELFDVMPLQLTTIFLLIASWKMALCAFDKIRSWNLLCFFGWLGGASLRSTWCTDITLCLFIVFENRGFSSTSKPVIL